MDNFNCMYNFTSFNWNVANMLFRKNSQIEYVKNSAINENFDMAKEGIENVERTWNSVKTVWHMFVDSSEVDKVEEHITQIKSYIDEEDKEEVIVNANELDRILNYIVKKQQVKIGNVL